MENLFEEGKACGRLYARIFEAQLRLLEKLGVDESQDLIEILDHEDGICRIIGVRMFDYGVAWAKKFLPRETEEK